MKFFQKSPKTQKLDYRILIVRVLSQKLKACRLFLIQKIIKKPAHEAELISLKKLNVSDLKMFSIFLIKQQNIDISIVAQDYEKILPGFEAKIENMSKENQEIIEKMQNLKKFEEAKTEIDRILGNVRKRLEKTKVSRKILKEKHRKNRERPILEVEEKQEIEKKPSESKKKPFFKERKEKKVEKIEKPGKISKKNIVSKEDYQKKDRIEKNQKISLKKYKEPIKNDVNLIQTSAQSTENIQKINTDYEGIHPSWQASLERRTQEKFSHFQGTRKKLT